MKKPIAEASLVVAAMLSLSACGKHGSDNSTAASEQTLNGAGAADGDGNVVVPEEGGFDNGAADLGNGGDDPLGNSSGPVANGP